MSCTQSGETLGCKQCEPGGIHHAKCVVVSVWLTATHRYNDGDGEQPAGAYCCVDGNSSAPVLPCPTCYFANAALPVVQAGVDCFVNTLRVPASKLVLAFPWYAYDYTCRNTTAANQNHRSTNHNRRHSDNGDYDPLNSCLVTAAVQVSYPRVQQLLAAAGTTVGWNANASTPYLGYRDEETGEQHRVDYDNSTSLRAKYSLARAVGAAGVGMWTASGLNYSDADTARQFWADLRVFRPTAPPTLPHASLASDADAADPACARLAVAAAAL
jgi:hypothetical protein